MGNYTKYTLEIIPKNTLIYDEFFFPNLDIGTERKWYHHEDECKIISNKYPQYLFVLTGESVDDIDCAWKKVFKDGEIIWIWCRDYYIPDVPYEIKKDCLKKFGSFYTSEN